MVEEKIVQLHKDLQPKLRQHLSRCQSKGVSVALTSGWRSPQEQWAIYARGREQRTAQGFVVTPSDPDYFTLKGGTWVVVDHSKVVTNATPEHAPHCRGAAYDLCPVVNERAAWDRLDLFQMIADCATGLGLTWGGSWPKFKDMPHFELPNWRGLPLKES